MPTILHVDWSNKPRTAFRRYIRLPRHKAVHKRTPWLLPTILHADWSNRPRTAFRRYIRSWLFRLAVTAFWRALTASWRQKGKQKQIFPRAVRTTELPSNPSPLTCRNNQIQILQTSSTHATMAAYVFQQDMNTHGTRLSHARIKQSVFDTTHQKWSKWKTNGSAVMTGLFRRKRQGWGRVSKTK